AGELRLASRRAAGRPVRHGRAARRGAAPRSSRRATPRALALSWGVFLCSSGCSAVLADQALDEVDALDPGGHIDLCVPKPMPPAQMYIISSSARCRVWHLGM